MHNLVDVGELVAIGFSADGSSIAANLTRIDDGQELFELLRTRLGRTDPDRSDDVDSDGTDLVEQAISLVTRYVRDSALTFHLKLLYDFRCQVCGTRLEQADGTPYAEGAHILPLGGGGMDSLDNLLCLCPNDHVRLDRGAIYLNDELQVIDRANGLIGELKTVESHKIDRSNAKSQKALFD